MNGNGFFRLLVVVLCTHIFSIAGAQQSPEVASGRKDAVELMNSNKNAQAVDVLQRTGKIQQRSFTAERDSIVGSLQRIFLKNQQERKTLISGKKDRIAVLKSENEDIDRENFKMIRNTLLFFGILVGVAVLILLNRFHTLGKLKEQQLITDAQVTQLGQRAAQKDTLENTAQQLHEQWVKAATILETAGPLRNKILSNKQHPLYKAFTQINETVATGLAFETISGLSEPGVPEKVDLNQLIEQLVSQAYHKTMRENPEFNCVVVKDLEKILPKVELEPDDIRFVIFNLLSNAFYAIREKSSNAPKGYEPKVTITTRKLPRFIQVRIRDNGSGISEKDPNRVFEPFYSSKNSENHPGLGLSESKRIITGKYKGELFIESDFTIGTDFIIRFPILTLI